MSLLPAAVAIAAAFAPPERIVVTAVASRIEEAIDATPASVTVITREDLERGLARDVRDALRYEPGISVENAPARFGLGNIAIRGLEGNRVQLMVDGVRMPDAFRIGSFSNASRNPYDLGLASRIEVLRGPASALYGSDALAGVVAITTLDPADVIAKGRGFGGFASANAAEADRSAKGSAVLAARADRLEGLLGATYGEGHERENRGEAGLVGNARTAPNPQDASARAALAKLSWRLADGGRLRATYDRFEREVATDVLSLNPQSPRTVSLRGDDTAGRTRAALEGLHYRLGPVERLSWTAYVQRSLTTQDTEEVRANTTAQCLSAAGSVTCRREARFTFRQREAGFTAIGRSDPAPAHQLVYGLEGARLEAEEMRDGRQTNLATGAVTNVVGADVFPTRDFPNSRVDRIGAFLQDEIAVGEALTLIPALRYDRYRMRPEPDAAYASANPRRTPVGLSDQAWSPKLGALFRLDDRHALTFQAATGFRAPPYFDANVGLSNLPMGFTVIPNPELAPEKSRGVEAGLRGRLERLDYSLTAFRTDYRDLIVSRAPLPCPGDPRCSPAAPLTFQSQNVTRARIEGVEVRAEARLAREWTARLGAAWTRGEDLTRGAPLNSIDPAKAVAGLEWNGVLPVVAPAKAGVQLHVTHVAQKKRIDAGAGSLFATPAFTLADLTGHVELGRSATLYAGVWNLFDRKHWLWSDVRGVVNPGASIDRYTQPGRNFGVRVRVDF